MNILNRIKFKVQGIIVNSKTTLSNDVCLLPGFANNKKGTIHISQHCELSKGVTIKGYGGNVIINENTFLGEYVVIYGHGGVTIGSNTLIAMHTCIVSSNHTTPAQNELIRNMPDILLPVNIGSDVWIGAGCKILGGITIGDGSVVGAGSVVTKDLPAYSISVGNPSKIIKTRK